MTVESIQLVGALDPRSNWEAKGCSVDAAMRAVGNRTTMLLLREAFYGTRRFDDFAQRVGVSPPVASTRLQELVDEGLLERQPYREPGQRVRQEYKLTDKGADLLPVLVALMEWGDRWLTDDGGPLTMRHAGCGEAVRAELVCAAGHHPPLSELQLLRAKRALSKGKAGSP